MLCQNCNNATATTFIKRTINGVTKEYHLCQKCAMQLGVGAFNMFDTDDFFASLLSNSTISKPKKVCKSCNSSYQDIVKKGRLGCPECYTTFEDELMPSIIKMQGRAIHNGKKPEKFVSVKNEIEVLENDLKEAIKNEEYEKAAQIRDILKEKRGDKNV